MHSVWSGVDEDVVNLQTADALSAAKYALPHAARHHARGIVMSCGHTNPAVIQLLADVLPGYGLTPYVVQRESMGFISTESGPRSNARRWPWYRRVSRRRRW